MLTTWDKAIAALLTSIVSGFALLNMHVDWLTPEVIVSISGALAGLITWLVPNKTA